MSLSKTDPGLNEICIGLGWEVYVSEGTNFDLDASAFLLGANGKVRSDADFIFYNQLKSKDGSVEHTGDNLTGDGEGDDEMIKVTLNAVPDDVQRIAFAVTIHEAEARKQNFGQVQTAFIRIINLTDNSQITKYDLSEEYSGETAMIFGELYRYNGEWKFKAIGQGFTGGLSGVAQHYGVNIK
ncbi:chemical-damaging agent resistance protein C [Planctomycetales bacterium]|nr:chemical-damaging agent resistance protein C [Planctomycetales bacterium]